MTEQPAKTFRIRPWQVGAFVEATGLITVIVGYFLRGGNVWLLTSGVIGSVVVGSLAWTFMARRFRLLLAGLVGGAVIGAISAWQLLWYEPFERQFFVAVVTLAFYPALGLIFGAIAEFISLIHYLVHGQPINRYPDNGHEPPITNH
ncbi:MAG: hypothetical protein PHT12_03690 [Patescibacteria group bacterium]|nr:hypothetical protein [Patescibacteria group bacterium]